MFYDDACQKRLILFKITIGRSLQILLKMDIRAYMYVLRRRKSEVINLKKKLLLVVASLCNLRYILCKYFFFRGNLMSSGRLISKSAGMSVRGWCMSQMRDFSKF